MSVAIGGSDGAPIIDLTGDEPTDLELCSEFSDSIKKAEAANEIGWLSEVARIGHGEHLETVTTEEPRELIGRLPSELRDSFIEKARGCGRECPYLSVLGPVPAPDPPRGGHIHRRRTVSYSRPARAAWEYCEQSVRWVSGGHRNSPASSYTRPWFWCARRYAYRAPGGHDPARLVATLIPPGGRR